MKQTYLFDFDGTLVDSMPAYARAVLQILDENQIPCDSDLLKAITPLGALETARYFISLGVNLSVEAILLQMKDAVMEGYLHTISAKSNVIKTLKRLKEQGVSLNVLTASPHLTVDPCLERLGIFDLFTNIWSCDDFGTSKSDPKIYQMAAERLGESVENIWFFDDNINAVQTAKTAGMQVCGVYDDSSKDCVEEIKQIADRYIYDFSELLN